MSVLDGMPQIATVEHLRQRWSGRPPGEKFRCRFCGHHFQLGDTFRFVFANVPKSPTRYGNFFVCTKCDEPEPGERVPNLWTFEANEKVLLKAAAQEAEWERLSKSRFWYFADSLMENGRDR